MLYNKAVDKSLDGISFLIRSRVFLTVLAMSFFSGFAALIVKLVESRKDIHRQLDWASAEGLCGDDALEIFVAEGTEAMADTVYLAETFFVGFAFVLLRLAAVKHLGNQKVSPSDREVMYNADQYVYENFIRPIFPWMVFGALVSAIFTIVMLQESQELFSEIQGLMHKYTELVISFKNLTADGSFNQTDSNITSADTESMQGSIKCKGVEKIFYDAGKDHVCNVAQMLVVLVVCSFYQKLTREEKAVPAGVFAQRRKSVVGRCSGDEQSNTDSESGNDSGFCSLESSPAKSRSVRESLNSLGEEMSPRQSDWYGQANVFDPFVFRQRQFLPSVCSGSQVMPPPLTPPSPEPVARAEASEGDDFSSVVVEVSRPATPVNMPQAENPVQLSPGRETGLRARQAAASNIVGGGGMPSRDEVLLRLGNNEDGFKPLADLGI